MIHFRLLGEVGADSDAGAVPLGSPRERALLATLLLAAPHSVPDDELVYELWGEAPPATARHGLDVLVSSLRKRLRPYGIDIVRGTRGFAADAPSATVDARRFEELASRAAAAHAAGDDTTALRLVADGRALWSGDALLDIPRGPRLDAAARELDERRIAALDLHAAIGFDGHVDVSGLIPDLERAVAAHPLQESLRAHLMLALYHVGRHADAVALYEEGRRILSEELGLSPSPELRKLAGEIVRHEVQPRGGRPTAARERSDPHGPVATRSHSRLASVLALVLVVAVAGGVVTYLVAGGSGNAASQGSGRVADVVLITPGQAGRTISLQLSSGLAQIRERYGLRTRLLFSGGTRTTATRAFTRAVALHPRLVILFSENLTRELSPEIRGQSRTRMILLDASAEFAGAPPNVTGITFANFQAAYLAGYLAGKIARPTPRGKSVAVVAGPPVTAVRELTAGFAAGAKAAGVAHRLVMRSRTFTETATCQALATRAIIGGATVIFDAAGPCGLGAIAAAGLRNVYAVGVDDDLSYLGPQVVASVVKHLDQALLVGVGAFIDGTLPPGKTMQLGLPSGAVGIVGLSPLLPETTRRALNEISTTLAREKNRAVEQQP